MTGFDRLRRLKERSIMLATPAGLALSAELRHIEREVQQEMDQLTDNAVAILACYYDEVKDPIPLLGRMAQVAAVMADPANITTVPMVQPCLKCGRELGSRISGPQDHDTCPPGRCQVIRAPHTCERNPDGIRVPVDEHCPGCARFLSIEHRVQGKLARQEAGGSHLDPINYSLDITGPAPQGLGATGR